RRGGPRRSPDAPASTGCRPWGKLTPRWRPTSWRTAARRIEKQRGPTWAPFASGREASGWPPVFLCLELEGEPELDVAHLVLGGGARDAPRVRPRLGEGADGPVGLAKVDVVEEVHDLDPELEVRAPARVEALEERGVHVPVAGPGQRVALHVA